MSTPTRNLHSPAILLDHVIYGTRDLESVAARLEQEHGMRFLPGGRHSGGTVNRVAPWWVTRTCRSGT